MRKFKIKLRRSWIKNKLMKNIIMGRIAFAFFGGLAIILYRFKNKDTVTNKYSDWVNENWKKNNILAPSLEAQKAINFLSNYLLGEDWYDSSGATHPEQVNARIVHEILMKYSPEYRKEIKKNEKNS